MRAGDRLAAAEFLDRYGSRIRRRIRGKLGPQMRRLFDSMDILSTLTRKVDLYVMSGQFNAVNEAHLWGMLMRMADHALLHKARVFRQLKNVEGEDGAFAQNLAARLRDADKRAEDGVEIEIDSCLRVLPDTIDRRILSLWLAGEPHAAIAEDVQLNVVTVRKRWERIKDHLKDRLQPTG